jgi:hypothetical protein
MNLGQQAARTMGAEGLTSFNTDPQIKKNMSIDEIYNSKDENGVYNTPENLDYEKDWTKNWYNDPKTKERLVKNVGMVEDDSMLTKGLNTLIRPLLSEDGRREDIASTYQQEAVNKIDKTRALYGLNVTEAYSNSSDLYQQQRKITGLGLDPENNMGMWDPSNDVISVNEKYGEDEARVTAVHEYTHATGLDSLMTPMVPDSKFQSKREVYPRIMQMRYLGGLKPGEKVTPEKLLEIKMKSNNEEEFFRSFSNEQIIEMMNTMASNNNSNSSKGLV